MAVDKLVDSTQLDADLTSVANAIRAKSGGSSQLAFPSGFVSEIGNIPTGGGGNDFVITFAQDQNDVWVPDKTLSEIQTAFRAGKTIGGNAPYSGDFLLVYTSFEDDDEDPILYYEIVMPFSDNSAGGYNVYDYYLDSQGVNDDGTYVKYDTSNATATDSDVASGKYYYNSTGKHTGTASGGGGASNVVTGTFTGTTTGEVKEITVNYSGNGYPICILIYPTEGAYNSTTGSFYNLVQRYACAVYVAIKCVQGTAPTWSGSQSDFNKATVIDRYKGSASTATTYSVTNAAAEAIFSNTNATASSTLIACMRSSTSLRVYIARTSYGFAANIEYTYRIIYSS